MRAEGIVENFDWHKLTPEDIGIATKQLIDDMKIRFEKIAGIKKEEVTFENTIQSLINVDVEMCNRKGSLVYPQSVVTDKKVREASLEAEKKLKAFEVEMSMKKEIFDNVCFFMEHFGVNDLSGEKKRYVEKFIVDGKRNGLHLDEAKREEVKQLRTKIADLGAIFSSNLNEENTVLEFTRDELEGVPEDLVDSFEKTDDGKCKVTLKYPHIFPVTRKCRNPATRRTMEKADKSVCLAENTKLLEEIVALRHKLATLLGYPNHAAYIHEIRMAKNPEKVAQFLSGLAEKLQPLWKVEKEDLLKLKEEECKKQGLDFNGKLDFWDLRYYTTLSEETQYSVDKEKLRDYFPMETVTKGLLEIYQQLLGITFIEVEEPEKWHEDVKLFQVLDTESREILGYFFLDLFPREGKYGHACVVLIQPGCINQDGLRQPSVCAVLANFAKPSDTKPSLLDHDEVETFFHEFGHAMHAVCAKTETARFSGMKIERDFVEAPSQMLENWCWEEEPLLKMSRHYKDGSPIPKDLLDKLIASRKAHAGLFNLRQIVLASFDQAIHTRPESDTAKVFGEFFSTILGVETIEDTNMAARFSHMVGYDAQYYGYLWSEVFSFDMFESRFKKEGLLNPKVGMDYRQLILKPGGSKDAADLLRDFLGRDPSDAPFLKSKGLK